MLYADDTQVYKSFDFDDCLSSILRVEKCVSNVKTWMMSNKLQMNEDKTEVLLVTAKRVISLQHLPEFMNIGTCVKFSPSVRNLGITLDSTLSLYQHVMNVCRVAYLELRRINSIWNLLSVDAVKTLVCSLVFSRLDYCNSLLVGLLQYLIKRLQGVKNAAARSILRTSRSEHISPLLQHLHCCQSIGELYARLLHYVILHHLALALNTCKTLLMSTPR